MWTHRLFARTLFAAFGLLVGIPGSAWAQEVVPTPEGMDVLTRGPVHEAYAEPVETGTPQPSLVVPKQPPEPVPEMPSEMKPEGDGMQWIPGYWSWDADRNDFIWVSGIWRQPPPGRRWVPGYWTQAANGSQWVPGFWAPADQQEVNYLQPPPAPVEAGPGTPPDTASSYVPGTWVPQGGQYLWRPGFWVTPQPGWVWVPAHYIWTPMGYVFVDGYWDYQPDNRGVLFAPVAFTRPLWTTPGWFYRPSYAVELGGLLASLFVRPGACSYYFGDYYGANYANLGFQPWFRYGANRYDPLFSYYRWRDRGNPGWYGQLQQLYEGRAAGISPRPPRTLAQQRALLQQTNIVNNVAVANNLHMVAPVTQVQNMRMTRLSASQVATHHEHAQNMRQIAQQRFQTERPAATTHATIGHAGAMAGRMRLPAAPPGPALHTAPGRPAGHPEAHAVHTAPHPGPAAPHAGPVPTHAQAPHGPAAGAAQAPHPGPTVHTQPPAPHPQPAPVTHAPPHAAPAPQVQVPHAGPAPHAQAPHPQPAPAPHAQPAPVVHSPPASHPPAPQARPAPVVHTPPATTHPAAAIHMPPVHPQAAHLSAVTHAVQHAGPPASHPAPPPPHPAPSPAHAPAPHPAAPPPKPHGK